MADDDLAAQLHRHGGWMRRLIGQSHCGTHAEPSWAAALSLDEACSLGSRFRQDAIYFIEDGVLFVCRCGTPREKERVAVFMDRLTLTTTPAGDAAVPPQ